MAKRNHFKSAELAVIREFVANIDPEIKVFRGSRFEVDIEEEKIYLGNKRFDRVSALFLDYWEDHFRNLPLNWLVLSILHEVGHIMTQDTELDDNRDLLTSMYDFMFSSGAINEQEYFKAYFGIPAERLATEWGIDFYLQNQDLCNHLALQLGA